MRLFLYIFIAIFLLPGTAFSADAAASPAPACSHKTTRGDVQSNGLKAVGLVVRSPLTKDIPAALSQEKLIELFSDRIRQQLLNFIAPDKNCQVQDVVIFRADDNGHPYDRFNMWEFINRPDTLIVKVDVNYLFYDHPTQKIDENDGIEFYWRSFLSRLREQQPKVAIVTFNFLRTSDLSPEEVWRSLNGGYQTYFPLDIPEDEIEKKLNELAKNIYGVPGKPDPKSQSKLPPAMKERREAEARAHVPPTVMISPPTPENPPDCNCEY